MNDFWAEIVRALVLGAALMAIGMWFLDGQFDELQFMLWLDDLPMELNTAGR